MAGWYGLADTKYQEPGAFAAILFATAAHYRLAVAALWYWFEPIAWGHTPFRAVDRLLGLDMTLSLTTFQPVLATRIVQDGIEFSDGRTRDRRALRGKPVGEARFGFNFKYTNP